MCDDLCEVAACSALASGVAGGEHALDESPRGGREGLKSRRVYGGLCWGDKWARGRRAWGQTNGPMGQLLGDHKRRAVRTWAVRRSTVQRAAGLRWTSVGPPGPAASRAAWASERKQTPRARSRAGNA